MDVNKVVFGDKLLIDLTSDSVTAEALLKPYTAHNQAGEKITGTCTFDVDSSDATVQVAEMLSGKTAYARGSKHVGTMPNRGAVSGTISSKTETYTIPQGYHDGSGIVGISSTEQAKIVASNIRDGITILGVTGSMSGSESEKPQEKTVTPSTTEQVILPDDGYTCLSQVTVKAIRYVESANAAGGTTVTIAG